MTRSRILVMATALTAAISLCSFHSVPDPLENATVAHAIADCERAKAYTSNI